MPERRQLPTVLEFLSGLFAGMGIIFLTFLLSLIVLIGLEKIVPYRGENGIMAVTWAILALGSGYLTFLYGERHNRPTSFAAGLVTAAGLFLLLDAACWNFSLV